MVVAFDPGDLTSPEVVLEELFFVIDLDLLLSFTIFHHFFHVLFVCQKIETVELYTNDHCHFYFYLTIWRVKIFEPLHHERCRERKDDVFIWSFPDAPVEIDPGFDVAFLIFFIEIELANTTCLTLLTLFSIYYFRYYRRQNVWSYPLRSGGWSSIHFCPFNLILLFLVIILISIIVIAPFCFFLLMI